jgi:Sulfotransferase domain
MMRFYFGHHKCASTYLQFEILRPVCALIGLKNGWVHSPKQFGGQLNRFVRDSDYGFLSYINAERAFIEQLDMPFQAVHVIRDPRDVVVSAYFSHLHSHSTSGWPELVEFRKKLTGLSTKEGLLAELEFIADLPTDGYNLQPFRSMMTWDYSDGRILELKFEDMVSDSITFFTRLGRCLGLTGNPISVLVSGIENKVRATPRKLGDGELLNVVAQNSFSKLSGRAAGIEDQTHSYRKGQVGDWRRHFDKDITKEFKKRFPGLVSRLGYESGENW